MGRSFFFHKYTLCKFRLRIGQSFWNKGSRWENHSDGMKDLANVIFSPKNARNTSKCTSICTFSFLTHEREIKVDVNFDVSLALLIFSSIFFAGKPCFMKWKNENRTLDMLICFAFLCLVGKSLNVTVICITSLTWCPHHICGSQPMWERWYK